MFEKLNNFSFKKLFKNIFLSNSDSPNKVASALSLGVFIAVIPIYGFQSIVAIGLSHLLRLNKAIVFTATNISWPPMVFGLIYASYQTGFFLFNRRFNANLGVSGELMNINNLGDNLYIFVIGSIIFGLILSAIVWITTLTIFKIIKKY
jgi:uncharacterized protein (DUF2062 family)